MKLVYWLDKITKALVLIAIFTVLIAGIIRMIKELNC